MKKRQIFKLLSGFTLLMFMQTVCAQYAWINEQGVKQFSDLPPPKNTPKDKILREPHGRVIRPSVESSSNENNTEKNEIDKIEKPKSIGSQIEELNKRRIAKEEAIKKEADEKQQKNDHKKNCDRAKNYKQTIDEGFQIMSRSAEGERVPLDEKQRGKELREVKKFLDDCKK